LRLWLQVTIIRPRKNSTYKWDVHESQSWEYYKEIIGSYHRSRLIATKGALTEKDLDLDKVPEIESKREMRVVRAKMKERGREGAMTEEENGLYKWEA